MARWMLICGPSSLIATGWLKTPDEAQSVLAEGLGYALVEFSERVDRGLYEEFKAD